jgi:hypothetical protein
LALNTFQRIKKANNWTDDLALDYLKCNLRGYASDWLRRYEDIAANAAKTLLEFLDDLKTSLRAKSDAHMAKREFRKKAKMCHYLAYPINKLITYYKLLILPAIQAITYYSKNDTCKIQGRNTPRKINKNLKPLQRNHPYYHAMILRRPHRTVRWPDIQHVPICISTP